MHRVRPARRTSLVEYAVREIDAVAQELERKGHRVIRLNIGDPVPYGFQPPEELKAALTEAVEEGYSFYSPSEGLWQLREAIAERERRVNSVQIEAEDVIVTQGVSEAINLVVTALIEEGDEVLLPSPCYPVYALYVRLCGGIPKFYKLEESRGTWRLADNVDELVTERTKLLVIINPHNPTGAVLEDDEIRKLTEAALSVNAPIISDEIYDVLVFEKPFHSTASIAKDAPVIGLNGFSKRWLATGWRLGYMYFSSSEELMEVKEAVVRLARTRLCPPTPPQRAATLVLKRGEGFLGKLKEELRKRRDYFVKLIEHVDGLSFTQPAAAFYAYPRLTVNGDWGNDYGFVKGLLLEEGVAVVHGGGFYDYRCDRFRAVFLPPPDIMAEAVERIARFIKRHTQ